MFIFTASKKEIEALDFSKYPDDYIISITDPDTQIAKISQKENNILRLSFYDIDSKIETLDGRIFYPMQLQDADKIVSFLAENNIKVLFVHCEAGLSRSVGVASAISQFFNGSAGDLMVGKTPNMHCYRIVLNHLLESKGGA